MNKLFKKAAALATAGILSMSCLSAQAFADSTKLNEQTAQVAYGASVVKPTYSIKGTAGVRKIKLSTTTAGATIYYTKDGSVPTTSSKVLASGKLLVLRANTKLRAIAVKGGEQSAVMNKTIKVNTVVGDVTGDGNINQTDFTRLKKYLAGSTSYICTDNADCNGDGRINNSDLTLLNQYLTGTISSFPLVDEETEDDSDSYTPAVTLTTPTVTVYRTMGGKKIELGSSDSGVTLYYTTNGTSPTTASNRYTSPFIITDDATIKVIASKSGSISNVKSRSVEVDSCSQVTTDKSTSTTYNDKIDVNLSCATSSNRIYYTTDGSDPRTSSTAQYYSKPITLEKDTTIKAYAQSKGYADSDVLTVSYKVNYSSGITISGTVWDDTPTTGTANGIRSATEKGLNDIVVYLYNTSNSSYQVQTKTFTKDGSAGYYEFTNVPKGSYKVEFYFNTQQYRAYPTVVTGGNQAVSNRAIPDMYVDYTGIYNASTGSKVSSINSYDQAVKSDAFLGTAMTNATYTATTEKVDLALISNAYGAINLSMDSQSFTGNSVKNGDKITYTVTLENASPSQTLKDAALTLFIDSNVENVALSSGSVKVSQGTTKNGYDSYYITGLFGSTGLAPKGKVSFSMTGTATGDKSDQIISYAEVSSYRYDNSAYDKFSIPGNLVIGSVKENDEAKTTTLTISDSASQTGFTYTSGENNKVVQLKISENKPDKITLFITNPDKGASDLNITASSSAVLYSVSETSMGKSLCEVEITVTGLIPSSQVSVLTISLKNNPDQTFTRYYTVTA